MSLNRYSDDNDNSRSYNYYQHSRRNRDDQPEWNERTDSSLISGSRSSQRHVHEIQGSVEIAEPEEEPHNHRFATVSGEAIPVGRGDHVHEVRFRTDFFDDHFHEFRGTTRGAVRVGDRHVHFLESVTSVNDGHRHDFRVATLIDNPIGEEDNC